MVSIRHKGQRGEREAADLIQGWVNEVMTAADRQPVELKRNLMQSKEGGYDLVGISWLALEVKRHETLSVNTWWKQTLRQTKDDQIPMLMYRQNRVPWRFRVKVRTAHYGLITSGVHEVVADFDLDNMKRWLQAEAWYRVQENS